MSFELFEFETPDTPLLLKLQHEVHLLETENCATELLLSNLEATYRIRHDMLHAAVTEMFGLPTTLGTNQPVKKVFPELLPDCNLTPDVLHVYSPGLVIIADFAITLHVSATALNKTQKYKLVAESLEAGGYQVKFFAFVLKPTMENFSSMLEDFKNVMGIDPIRSNEISTNFLSLILEVEHVQYKIRTSIANPELITTFLMSKFGQSELMFTGKFEEPTFTPDKYKTLLNLDYDYKSEEELLKIFTEILSDDDAVRQLQEIPTSPDIFKAAYAILKSDNSLLPKGNPKPSIYTPLYPEPDLEIPEACSGLAPEQASIYNLLQFISTHIEHDDGPAFAFLKDIALQMKSVFESEYSAVAKSLFSRSQVLQDPNEDMNLRNQYHEYRAQKKASDLLPKAYIDWLQGTHINVPPATFPRPVKQKIFKFNLNEFEATSKHFFHKAHVGVKDKRDKRLTHVRESIGLEHSEDVETFLEDLTKPIRFPKSATNMDEFLGHCGGSDTELASFIKKAAAETLADWIDCLDSLAIYRYSKLQSLICEQLMHFLQLSMPHSQFAMFSCGMKHQAYLSPIGQQNLGSDVGKAFLSFGITDNPNFALNIYGQVFFKKVKIYGEKKPYYIFVSSWRRLTAERANFCKDVFYTSLSTALNSMLRHMPKPTYTPECNLLIKHFWAKRVLLGLSVSQSVAERASDMKNLLMHCFSEYSNSEEFILDKFAAPYKNCAECWIVSRLKNASLICADYQQGSTITIRQPMYAKGKRLGESLGGFFNILSIWGDFKNKDPQDILDDLYLYVLTPKEPSNIHHENIKAVNTILKFQKQFDNMPCNMQKGEINTVEDIKRLIQCKTSIGFSRDVVRLSTLHTIGSMHFKDLESRLNKALSEPLLEVSSTKSCIPELIRYSDAKPMQRTKKKQNLNYIDEHGKPLPKTYQALRTRTQSNYIYVNQGTNRMKVHDAMVDILENGSFPTTFSLAQWNIVENSSRVLADICIKAQYGSKREFYVVNLGAKCMMRLMENCFKAVCVQNTNEMISVPGDKKLLHMQEKVNNIMLEKTSSKMVFSVNGDCTKWSAAETLEAFDELTSSMQPVFGEKLTPFLRHICYSWANKHIQIPSSIIRNTQFMTDATDYLKDNQTLTIKSTQNFLQGMMNYASSFKAVCCSNYTLHIWKKLHPSSKLEMEHLEHSDDYVLILKVSCIKELLEFRTLHRMMMKLHGFNDSTKKTNTQKVMTEFISLIAFNGQMIYPQIKKVKEVGMNVGCTGFKDDTDTALSRAAEAFRNGCDLTTSYIMQRIHMLNIARSYSVLPSMTNQMYDLDEIFNAPSELFGIPDILPNVYMMTNGNANNYRINKYVGSIAGIPTKQVFQALLRKSLDEAEPNELPDDINSLNETYFYHPTYSYDQENKLIKKIRKSLNITFDQCQEFLSTNKSYNFMKPVELNSVRLWLHSMYYKKNFSVAYSRMSRAQLTMRISRLVRNKCILKNPHDENSDVITIKDYYDQMIRYITCSKQLSFSENEAKLLNRMLLSHDPSLDIIYGIMNNSILEFDKTNGRVLSAVLTPYKPSWVLVDNPVNSVFQYVFDKKNFFTDNRPYYGLASIERDKEALEAVYNVKLNEESPYFLLNMVYKDLMLFRSKQNIAMSYIEQTNKFEEFIASQFEYQINNGVKYRLITKGELAAVNPYTQVTFFKKHYAMKSHEASIILDDLILMIGMLYHGEGKDYDQIRDILKNTHIDARIQMAYPNAYEFIHQYLYENLNSSDPRLYELKSFAFLKWVIAGDVRPLKQLTNQYGNYSYRYRKKKMGCEIVDFEYQKSKYMGLHIIESGTVIIFTTTVAKGKNKVAYLISLKLFDKITQSTYETQLATLTTKAIGKINAQEIKEKTAVVTTSEAFVFSDNWREIPLSLVEPSDMIMPIVLMKNIQHAHYTSQAQLPDYVHFDEGTSTFYCAGLKFYTVPYLQCKQVNVLRYHGDQTIKGINIDWYLQANRFEKLITGCTDNMSTKGLIKEIKLANLTISLSDLYFDNKQAQQILINNVDDLQSISVKSSESSHSSQHMDTTDFDDMNLDIDDNFLDDMDLDFDLENMDFEIMEEDNVEFESNDTSKSSGLDEESDIPVYNLSKVAKMEPYILELNELRFSQYTPRSLNYLKNGYRLIDTVIAKTSWKTQYMYNLPAIKQFAFLARFVKWCNKLHCRDIDFLHGKEALKYILFKEICLGMRMNFKMTDLYGLQEGTCYLQIDGQIGQFLAAEDPTDEEILAVLNSRSSTVVCLTEHIEGFKPGIYVDGKLRSDIEYDISSNFIAIATDSDVILEELPKLELDEGFLDKAYFKWYVDPIKLRDKHLSMKISALIAASSHTV